MKKPNLIIGLGILYFAFVQCSLPEVAEQIIRPEAAFSVANDNCQAPCSVSFSNTSSQALSYRWRFGNGQSSLQESPTHEYLSGGTFTVTLTAFSQANQTGEADSVSTQVTIQEPNLPVIATINPTSGQKGDTVTIQGSDFGTEIGALTVLFFNEAPAVLTSITDNQIRAIVPQGADTGPVSVRTQSDQTVTGPVFTYNKPEVNSFVPLNGRRGDEIALQGAHFGNDPAEVSVFVNESEANVVTVLSASRLTFEVPTGAGSGPIRVVVSGYEASAEGFRYLLSGDVSTYAGTGVSGFLDGPALSAQFFFPYGLHADDEGNVYVGDFDNQRIRKISTEGQVSTVAGSGAGGFDNGQALSATFSLPASVVHNNDQAIYVADFGNNAIRKIDLSNNTVSTLAGNGTAGYNDQFGASARFDHPTGLAIDLDNNLLVADRDNHTIRQITPAGSVNTFAGNGSSGDVLGNRLTNARFRSPESLTVAPDGSIYLTDSGNQKIKRINPDGSVETIAGNGIAGNTNGIGTNAQFNSPIGIAIDASGNIFVADRFNNKIRVVAPDGFTYDLAGDGTFGTRNGEGLQAQISGPFGLTIDAGGNIYVACFGTENIRKIVVE